MQWEDMGIVLTGELVRAQMKNKGVKDTHEIKRVVRKATMEDITTWQAARERESALFEARKIIAEHHPEMKLGDVEFKGRHKCVLLHGGQRVDFRIGARIGRGVQHQGRVRQIGARQESARLGGIGICGRSCVAPRG